MIGKKSKNWYRIFVLFCMAVLILASAFTANARPALTLSKSANLHFYSGWKEVTYTYTLTNSGDVPLSGPFTVTDNLVNRVSCSDQSELLPGKSVLCHAHYFIDRGQHWTITNTATATAQYNSQPVTSNTASASIRYVRPPQDKPNSPILPTAEPQ